MPPEKIPVAARIPKDLYTRCLQDFDNITTAINTALEFYYNQPVNNCLQNENECLQNENDCIQDVNANSLLEEHIKSLALEITSLKESLAISPDPVELAEVRAHFEGLQRLTEEKDKRINDLTREVEGLQKEVERLDMFAHYFKSVEVKQIEAPAAEKVKPWWRFW
jgi:DNA repair ATPase RecN